MTISEAITLVNTLKPNQYDDQRKVQWLSKLDQKVYAEVIETHEGNTLESFSGYTADTADTTDLLIKTPYDEDVYNYYLQSMIDRSNGETAKYNQSAAAYNAAYSGFTSWYNRHHTPLPTGSHFSF